MTFEEFEKAKPSELREYAKARFEMATTSAYSIEGISESLAEAQFYLGELDRMENAKIARRDFRMELIVILLIGFELIVAVGGIIFATREAKSQTAHEDAMMDKQNTI